MERQDKPSHYIRHCADCGRLNANLEQGYKTCDPFAIVRRSHCFGGRYENIYIDATTLTDIIPILHRVKQYASEILDRPVTTLQAGFWFNEMGPGESTSRHNHDDYDELLSAVYYIKVPQGSGQLILLEGNRRIAQTPKEGQCVLFAPSLDHEVTTK